MASSQVVQGGLTGRLVVPNVYAPGPLVLDSPANKRKTWIELQTVSEVKAYVARTQQSLVDFATLAGLRLNDFPDAVLERAIVERLETLRNG